MQISGLQYLRQKEHKVSIPNLSIFAASYQVERKSLKLGIHFNLKVESLGFSRYHLISLLITQKT